MDASGVIEKVGASVTNFKKGDEVFGITTDMLGAWAEYACAKEDEVYLKPENLTFEESATLPVACTVALGAIRLANIQNGQHVLVNGASGGVGLFTVQILKSFGATVTSVCSSRNTDIVRFCGSDFVIDYTKEDFTKNNKQYDCILAVNGFQTLDEYKNSLAPLGIYIPVGGSQQCIEAAQCGKEVFKDDNKRLEIITFFTIKREFPFIKKLAETKKIVRIIDDVCSINDISTAIENLVHKHAKGKTVMKVKF